MRSSCTVVATLAVAATLATPVSSAAGGDTSGFVDRVGTLETDATLDAQGSLGGLTVDKLGYLYVANFRDAVWRIDPATGETVELSRAQYGASGMVVDGRGRLYQANFQGNTITRIDRDGTAVEFAGEGLDGPVGMAIDGEGRLVVCNCRGNSLSRVSTDGRVEPFATSDLFACPNGIVLADDGSFYVTNYKSYDIVSVTPQGEVAVFATVPGGAGNTHLAYAKGVFYVTKIISNRVFKLTADGEATPLAGTGQPGHEDGPALEATMFRPNGIAVSPRGDTLYVDTMVGEYSKPVPSEIVIRTIALVSVASVVRDAVVDGGLEGATRAYRAYKSDPVRSKENTSAEMIALGFAYLTDRKIAEATTVFRLNAESYPDDPTAQYQLGELYRYTGRNDEAVAQYRRVLELAPGDPRATSRLAQPGD